MNTRNIRQVLSEKQIHDLLAAAAADPKCRDLHDFIAIIAHTGLRPRELAGLRWAQVKVPERHIVLSRGKADARKVPVAAPVLAILERRRRSAGANKCVWGAQPWRHCARARHLLRKLAIELGIGPVNLQDLRRAFVDRLIAGGFNASRVARIMRRRRSFAHCCLVCGAVGFAKTREKLSSSAARVRRGKNPKENR